MKFFDHKDLGNHLLQLCPKVVKHPVYYETNILLLSLEASLRRVCKCYKQISRLLYGSYQSLLLIY